MSSQVPGSYPHPGKCRQLRRDNVPVDDHSICPVRPPLQPLARRDQALGIVLLFGCASAAFHHAHGERSHITVQPRHFGQQLPVFPNHNPAPHLSAALVKRRPGPGRVRRSGIGVGILPVLVSRSGEDERENSPAGACRAGDSDIPALGPGRTLERRLGANPGQTVHPAFNRHVEILRAGGVTVLLGGEGYQPHPPHQGSKHLHKYPWQVALDTIEADLNLIGGLNSRSVLMLLTQCDQFNTHPSALLDQTIEFHEHVIGLVMASYATHQFVGLANGVLNLGQRVIDPPDDQVLRVAEDLDQIVEMLLTASAPPQFAAILP